MKSKYDRIITFGTFDLFHIGHLRIIERAKKLCDKLIVGISTDSLSYNKKSIYPVYNENDRLSIVSALRDVDGTFFEESLELKKWYILEHKADALVMGDDWKGRFDELSEVCEVIYLPRTPNISSTEIKITVTERA